MSSVTKIKDNFIDLIKNFPNDWELSKNKYALLKISNGKNLSDTTDVLSLTINGIKIKEDLTFGKTSESYIGHQLVKQGNLVFTPRDFDQTPILSDVSKHDGCISNLYIVDKPNNEFLPEYINYFWHGLKYSFDYFKNFSYGIRFSFNREQFDEIPLLKPSLDEQKIMSAYLDINLAYLDSMVEKIQKKINLLIEKRTSLINHYITKGLNPNFEMKDSGDEWIGDIPKHWDLIKLKYLVSYNQETLSEKTDPDYEIHYIEIGDVDYIDGININKKIKFLEAPSRARRVVQPNDVLISTVRTYLRSIGVVPDVSNVICSTGFCVLRDNSGLIEQKFLSYAVKSEWFVSNVISNSYGVSYPAINSSEIVELKIVLPPKNEQLDIIKFLDTKTFKEDQNILLEKRRISLMKEFRQSLISSIVTGKHRVTEDMV
tara:strand:- start:404 stop:1693 length:1290 start_codon:yes stop_codon:yes gene_type:complete